jgi:short-subunit dehydrogenase
MKQIDPIRPSFGASDETVAIVDVADGSRTPARQQGDSAPRVVLTGASSGIGRATALAFARQGASLVLASRNEPSLQDVAAACEQAGGKALAVPTDVTDADAVKALANAAIAHLGHVDMWINNVGVGAVGLFDETPMEAHRRVIEANLMGHMHGAYAILPHFKSRGRGTLVNMISLGGWVAAPYATAYTASKFALRGFSESLRSELSGLPYIHVCEVFPTFVDTPGMSHGANYSGRQVRPPPPVVDPRRVADALVALATRPRARTYIGAPAHPGILAHALAPTLVGMVMKWATDRSLQRADPASRSDGNLFAPSRGNAIDGGFRSTKANPAALALGVGAAAVGALTLAGAWALRQRRGA